MSKKLKTVKSEELDVATGGGSKTTVIHHNHGNDNQMAQGMLFGHMLANRSSDPRRRTK